MKYAKDYKCVKCKKDQAVCFWPTIDPDIESHPYCRECKDKIDLELYLKMYEA